MRIECVSCESGADTRETGIDDFKDSQGGATYGRVSGGDATRDKAATRSPFKQPDSGHRASSTRCGAAGRPDTVKEYTLPGTRFNRLLTTMLKTDLEVGMTFSTIALQSVLNERKRDRNRKNARIAHDSVLRKVQQSSLSEEDVAEIYSRLAELKGALQELGESF